jgi:EAL domain-containing protein (putative c-di-GMP-specific phosphodiesterase class I)
MTKDANIKEQRDRFLAFAFASSDLFIEVSEEGKITFALGAAKGLTGINEKALIGLSWLEMFSPYDQSLILTTYERAKPGQRCGPLLVTLSQKMGNKAAIMSGIKMPESNVFYVTLGISNALMSKLANMMNPPASQEVLSRENFNEAVKDALFHAKSTGENVKLTLLDFTPTEEYKATFGTDGWKQFQDAVGEVLVQESYDGYTAGIVADGRFSVLHDENITADFLRDKIFQLSKQKAPNGQGVKVETRTIASDLDSMTERDAARAVFYTIHEFERKGTELTIETLNSGFNDYVNANAQKMKEFKNFISSSSFNIFFQPIVNLQTKEASHYEMLCRFSHGDTQEWIMFGEDVGMAAEFDMAMCERAINFIKFKGGVTHTKFSLNISGQSIEDEDFFENLLKLLNKHPGIANRLMFEVTESSQIQDLKKVSAFVSELRNQNFKIALDDFGAGAASFRYLQKLDVDYVKIDGKYTRKLLSSQRDVALVKNLVQMCADLNMKVIAEFVEDEQQIKILQDMGVEYGQGYLFGKPASSPNYINNKK